MMEEGTLSRWLVNEGDFVAPGQIIAEIETENAILELEAGDYCKIEPLTAKEGQTVKAGTVFAVMVAVDSVAYNRSKIRLVR